MLELLCKSRVSANMNQRWTKFMISSQLVVIFQSKCCTQYAVIVDNATQADCVVTKSKN